MKKRKIFAVVMAAVMTLSMVACGEKQTGNDTPTTAPTATAAAMTAVSDTGVYLDTTAGVLTATTFKGALSGNASSATYASNVRNV